VRTLSENKNPTKFTPGCSRSTKQRRRLNRAEDHFREDECYEWIDGDVLEGGFENPTQIKQLFFEHMRKHDMLKPAGVGNEKTFDNRLFNMNLTTY
jgi:hypothetical protein